MATLGNTGQERGGMAAKRKHHNGSVPITGCQPVAKTRHPHSLAKLTLSSEVRNNLNIWSHKHKHISRIFAASWWCITFNSFTHFRLNSGLSVYLMWPDNQPFLHATLMTRQNREDRTQDQHGGWERIDREQSLTLCYILIAQLIAIYYFPRALVSFQEKL